VVALNQSPISLHLADAAANLEPGAFLRKVLQQAIWRCGTSKETVQLSMAERIQEDRLRAADDPGYRDDLSRRAQADRESAARRAESAAAGSSIDGFLKLTGGR